MDLQDQIHATVRRVHALRGRYSILTSVGIYIYIFLLRINIFFNYNRWYTRVPRVFPIHAIHDVIRLVHGKGIAEIYYREQP